MSKNLKQSYYEMLHTNMSAKSSFDDEDENGEWSGEGEDGDWSDDEFNDDMGYEQYDDDDYQSPDSEYEE